MIIYYLSPPPECQFLEGRDLLEQGLDTQLILVEWIPNLWKPCLSTRRKEKSILRCSVCRSHWTALLSGKELRRGTWILTTRTPRGLSKGHIIGWVMDVISQLDKQKGRQKWGGWRRHQDGGARWGQSRRKEDMAWENASAWGATGSISSKKTILFSDCKLMQPHSKTK